MLAQSVKDDPANVNSRKYVCTLLCGNCGVNPVGTLYSDDERMAERETALDLNEVGEPVHVCMPCTPDVQARLAAAYEEQKIAEGNAQLQAIADLLGVDKDAFIASLRSNTQQIAPAPVSLVK